MKTVRGTGEKKGDQPVEWQATYRLRQYQRPSGKGKENRKKIRDGLKHTAQRKGGNPIRQYKGWEERYDCTRQHGPEQYS